LGIDTINMNKIRPNLSLAWNSPLRPESVPIDFSTGFFGAGSSPLMTGFMGMDFMDIMAQQQQFLMMMMSMAPTSFSVGVPTHFEPTSGAMNKKIASMKLSKGACQQINDISKRLKISPDNLKALIYSESGGNPHAVNPKSAATGLIQFMPKTAQGLGITTAQLKTMTAEQQLPYVEKYLANTKRRAGFGSNEPLSAGQLYALVFMPSKAKQGVMCAAGTKAYSWNKGLDKNHDGIISINELGKRIGG